MRTYFEVSTTSFALSLLLLGAPGTCRADNLFVSSFNGNAIEEINSSGVGTLFASFAVNTFPGGLAFDSSGNLFVALYGKNTIEEFKSSGGVLSSNGTVFASSGLNEPQDLAFDSAGNLYVSNQGNDTIEKYNSLGVGSVFAQNPPGKIVLQQPFGLAFDSSGNLYVANFASNPSSNNVIEKYNSSGVGTEFATVTPVNNDKQRPTGLAFDSSGNLFASTVGGFPYNSIEEYNSSGAGTLFSLVLSNAIGGIAFDSGGNLYGANADGNIIEKYSAAGLPTAFSSGLGDPGNLAFQPIPESSTWALVAVGMVGLLSVRPRRV